MRRGKVVGEFDAEDISIKELAEHLAGSELPDMLNKERSSDERILKLSSVRLREKGKKPLLCNIKLEVNKGETLGIAGVSGNSQSELKDLVAGLVLPSEGSIEFNRKDITRDNRFKRIVSGISYIPEDRSSTGLCGEWSVEENVIAGYGELFDMQEDPRETTNLLYHGVSEDVMSVRNHLYSKLAEYEERYGLSGYARNGKMKR